MCDHIVLCCNYDAYDRVTIMSDRFSTSLTVCEHQCDAHGITWELISTHSISRVRYVKTVSVDAANAMRTLETMCATTVQQVRFGGKRIMEKLFWLAVCKSRRWIELGEIWRRGGDSNPRYRFWPVQRFSKFPVSQPGVRNQ